MNNPKTSHLEAAFRVLRYLKSAPGKGVLLSAQHYLSLTAYCDSDWGTVPTPMTRRSATGYCIKLGESLLSWKTKKQATVSRFSAEADYRAIANTTCEVVWIVGVLRDTGEELTLPVTMYCDNIAALHIAANPLYHERTKHIEIDCHLVREKICDKLIKTSHIKTGDQPADLFTKALGKTQHQNLIFKLGMLELFQV